MLDHWDEARNFSGYYDVCEPVLCTFTTIQKKSIIYLFTLLIGLYGGLTVALRIIAPLLIVFGHFLHSQFKQRCLSRWQIQKGTHFDRLEFVNVMHITLCHISLVSSSNNADDVITAASEQANGSGQSSSSTFV